MWPLSLSFCFPFSSLANGLCSKWWSISRETGTFWTGNKDSVWKPKSLSSKRFEEKKICESIDLALIAVYFKDKEKFKSSEPHEKPLWLSLMNFKKSKEEEDKFEQLESHNYTFMVNRTNRGLWTERELIEINFWAEIRKTFFILESSAAFVSVMMVEGDFCMLTLCEPEQLISFILSKHRIVNLTMVTEDAYYILEDRELFVDESIIVQTCASSTLQSVSAFVLIVVALIAHFHWLCFAFHRLRSSYH